MKKLYLLILMISLAALPAITKAQLFEYKQYYSQSTYGVTKKENLKYAVGATNYYLYDGSGDKNSRSNYNHVTRKDLTFCSQDTIRQNNISTSTAHYVSQEGNDYNELNTNNGQARTYARRGIVVVSPNTRYRYHNKQYDRSDANRWTRSDGSALFNGSSTHLEPLVVDIKRLVRWLSHPDQVSRYNIDPNNIFVYGSSGAAKIASLAAITATNVLTTDDPAHRNSGNANYQFELSNNNLSVSQKALRGAILLAGDTNGTRNLQLIDTNTGDFMFWHGTTDRSVLHGMAETIEDKCEYIGCATQFYSLPGVVHTGTSNGKALHTNSGAETVGINAHVHDFIVNHLKKGSDNRAELSINPNKVSFRENSGTAKIEVTLSRALSQPVRFTMAADQMREVTQQNGAQGQYQYIQRFVANDSVSSGPLMYDQGTGVAFEKSSNLPASYKGLNVHTNGPGEGNPVLIPSSSDYFFNDFHGKKQVLTIPAGQTRATFNVNLVNDTLREENECFKVRLLNAQGARIGNSVETITILDDDNPNAGTSVSATCRNPGATLPPPTGVQVSVKSRAVQESIGQANIEISSDRIVSQNVVLSYRTVIGNASATNGDYIYKEGQVTIRKGTQNAFVPITIIDDTRDEINETFSLEIKSVVSNNATIKTKRATVTIVDNDNNTVPAISVELKHTSESSNIAHIKLVSDRPVTEDIKFRYYTVSRTARSFNTTDFVYTDGIATIQKSNDVVFVPVTITNDNLAENEEFFEFRIDKIVEGNAVIGVGRNDVIIADDD